MSRANYRHCDDGWGIETRVDPACPNCKEEYKLTIDEEDKLFELKSYYEHQKSTINLICKKCDTEFTTTRCVWVVYQSYIKNVDTYDLEENT